MIAALIVSVLALIALAYVMAPLMRGARADVPSHSARLEDANARKRAALGALVDIEGERLAGKLSDEDFEALRAEYEAEAMAALSELDTVAALEVDDADLEAEIAAIREDLECPACGSARIPGEECPRCGG